MITLYTEQEFNLATSGSPLRLECEQCHNAFSISKCHITCVLNNPKRNRLRYCSRNCQNLSRFRSSEVQCKQCSKLFVKRASQIKRTPNHFCSRSCAGTYNNTHKKKGTRRSKLEVWLEEQLPVFYPGLEFHFNRKDAINSELDIFMPSLKLAFELNGIYHYEPIHGQDKLDSIRSNDQRKFQACLECNIELCTIDSSGLIYFKPDKAQKYLDIICKVVNQKLQ